MGDRRIVKRTLDYCLLAIAVVFIISLVFVPLHYFSIYGQWLITAGLLLFVSLLCMGVYYFVKDTPRRKWGKPQKQDTRIIGIKRKTFFSIMDWLGFFVLLLFLINLKKGNIGGSECPDTIQGNAEATLKVRYFYSPFCSHCWQQEPIIRDMLKLYGNSLSLERYDIRYCDAEVAKNKMPGAPGFVFLRGNDSDESASYGFLTKHEFEQLLRKE